MKLVFLFFGILLSTSLVRQDKTESQGCSISYSYAGLGSALNSMQPVFRVNGTNCMYTLEENSSWTGNPPPEPETLYIGKFRKSSIDSILALVSTIDDTLIYRTNPGIMSGEIHTIAVQNEKTNLTFCLHNATDPIAENIVSILNSNIPNDQQKLWLLNLPESE